MLSALAAGQLRNRLDTCPAHRLYCPFPMRHLPLAPIGGVNRSSQSSPALKCLSQRGAALTKLQRIHIVPHVSALAPASGTAPSSTADLAVPTRRTAQPWRLSLMSAREAAHLAP